MLLCKAQIKFVILISHVKPYTFYCQIWFPKRWSRLLVLILLHKMIHACLVSIWWIQDHREPTSQQTSRCHPGRRFYKRVIRPRQPHQSSVTFATVAQETLTRVVTLLRAAIGLHATIQPSHLVLVQLRGSTAAAMKKHANNQPRLIIKSRCL
jgi:hypothetical protein